MPPVLPSLLTPPSRPDAIAELESWLRATAAPDERVPCQSAIDRAIARAQRTERRDLAIACGHQGAIEQLLGDTPCPRIRALCISEERGPHPRWIRTRLHDSGRGLQLDGSKRWATLSPCADELLVAASVGQQDDRNKLRLVRVPAAREGVRIERLSTPGDDPQNANEVDPSALCHGAIELQGVLVEPEDVFPGDAYVWAIKPFRTLEDLFVPATLLACLLAAGLRRRADREELERFLGWIVSLRSLVTMDPGLPIVHLALAGVQRELSEHWLGSALVQELAAEMPRWKPLPGIFKVAGSAREARRQRAWTSILENEAAP